MKILTIIILFTNIIFAKTIFYDLKTDKEKIGTFTVKIENFENQHTQYHSHLKFTIKYMFWRYQYEYKESVLFDKDGLVEFVVEEFNDGDYKKMSAKEEDKKLIFANGKEILLSQIDTIPFGMDILSENNSTQTKFTLRTFKALTGDLTTVVCKVLSSKKVDKEMQYIVHKKNSTDDKVEILTITKEGKLLNVKGEDYEMTLRVESK